MHQLYILVTKSKRPKHQTRLPHNRRPAFLIPLNAAANPLNRLLHTRPRQRRARQHPTIPQRAALLPLKHLPHKPLLNPHHLDAILAVLLIRQHEQRHALSIGIEEHVLEHEAALVEAAGIDRALGAQTADVGVAHVGAVDDEHDGVARRVVVLPQPAQRVLPAHVPDAQVQVAHRDRRHVLPHRRRRRQVRVQVRRVRRLDLLQQRGLARVVEPEQQDRVLCGGVSGGRVWEVEAAMGKGCGRVEPSLAVASWYSDFARWYMVSWTRLLGCELHVFTTVRSSCHEEIWVEVELAELRRQGCHPKRKTYNGRKYARRRRCIDQ